MKFYSQFGEDKYLYENCDLPEIGTFVDVGAGGIHNSNSLFFEELGWKCLCVEPDERHEGLDQRKLVDHSVVGSKKAEVVFTFHRFPELSGLYHKAGGKRLQMVRLDDVLEKYDIEQIDILSVDVEGNEINVLNGFSFEKYKPSYLIVEYTNQFKGDEDIHTATYIESYGYKIIHKTQSNLIAERLRE